MVLFIPFHTLALFRIVKAEATDVVFEENKTLKPKEYFRHTLGITLGKGAAEDIELCFLVSAASRLGLCGRII